ncbi:hypothetical protein COLO4_05241 [Corchorus olitorius]|uniref:Uncharacterized protein n=1 Tax=Corchorus olitorius TaxID=93759 RepID=A0A1R3KRE7_9ROSI|nr:hypothetical protein COLO4_05241 [Corchorus olitorius]
MHKPRLVIDMIRKIGFDVLPIFRDCRYCTVSELSLKQIAVQQTFMCLKVKPILPSSQHQNKKCVDGDIARSREQEMCPQRDDFDVRQLTKCTKRLFPTPFSE